MDAALQRIDGSSLRFITRGTPDGASSVMLMLHGVGGDCHSLARVGDILAERLPGMMFVIPNAPLTRADGLENSAARILGEKLANAGAIDWERKRTWVAIPDDLSRETPATLEDRIRPPVRAVNRLADLLLARHGLDPGRLVLFGFSQGGMIAIRCGLDRERPCAAVVTQSAHFVGAPDVKSRPSMLLMVGDRELHQGMPLAAIHPASVDGLTKLGVGVESHVVSNCGHLNAAGIDRVATFVGGIVTEWPGERIPAPGR